MTDTVPLEYPAAKPKLLDQEDAAPGWIGPFGDAHAEMVQDRMEFVSREPASRRNPTAQTPACEISL